jgi:hypothetical protein
MHKRNNTKHSKYMETTWKDLGVEMRIILKWIFKRWNGGTWTGLIWLRIGADSGLL